MRYFTFLLFSLWLLAGCSTPNFDFDGSNEGWTITSNVRDKQLLPGGYLETIDYKGSPTIVVNTVPDNCGALHNFTQAGVDNTKFAAFQSPDLTDNQEWNKVNGFTLQVGFNFVTTHTYEAQAMLTIVESSSGNELRLRMPTIAMTSGQWTEVTFPDIAGTIANTNPAVTDWKVKHVGVQVLWTNPFDIELSFVVDSVVPLN